MSQSDKKVPLFKPRFGSGLGFKSAGNPRGGALAGKPGSGVVKFDPARFKTQHKG